MDRVKNIFDEWKIVYNLESLQTQIASKRLDICLDCEYIEKEPIFICKACNCTLKEKIYNPTKGACPKEKWLDVETKYNL